MDVGNSFTPSIYLPLLFSQFSINWKRNYASRCNKVTHKKATYFSQRWKVTRRNKIKHECNI